jgi:hypothetical protein
MLEYTEEWCSIMKYNEMVNEWSDGYEEHQPALCTEKIRLYHTTWREWLILVTHSNSWFVPSSMHWRNMILGMNKGMKMSFFLNPKRNLLKHDLRARFLFGFKKKDIFIPLFIPNIIFLQCILEGTNQELLCVTKISHSLHVVWYNRIFSVQSAGWCSS